MAKDDREHALDNLLNRQAILDCLNRYARGVDRLDAELIRSAFWPDALDSHGRISGSPEEFLSAWLPTQERREVCQHVIANHNVDFDGPDSADAETYVLVAIKDYDSLKIELMGGRYLDLFSKREGDWRIKTRLVILDWQGVADASEMAARMSLNHRGSRDMRDPSYERPVLPRPALS